MSSPADRTRSDLRAPGHPWAQALLQAFGRAVAAPSANRFGRVSPTTADHVRADLGVKPEGAVDLILDGGPCPVGIESTIVDLSGACPRLLRQGSSRVRTWSACSGWRSKRPMPARRAFPALWSGITRRARRSKWWRRKCFPTRLQQARTESLAVLAPVAVLDAWPSERAPLLALAAPQDADDYARVLYANLRRLDAARADRIVIVAPPAGERWEPIHDRLRRAQAGSRTGDTLDSP